MGTRSLTVCCSVAVRCTVIQCFELCCIVLQFVSVLQCEHPYTGTRWPTVYCSALQYVAVCFRELQCLALCCSVLQCVAV